MDPLIKSQLLYQLSYAPIKSKVGSKLGRLKTPPTITPIRHRTLHFVKGTFCAEASFSKHDQPCPAH